MSQSEPSHTLSPESLREYQKATALDWASGMPIAVLLERVNQVAVALPSPGGAEKRPDASPSRVSRTFTERSFRHYQTLGCIDPPQKQGRSASYELRHFLQALLVRKLLWQRLSSEQIAALLVGRTADDLERMLVGGVELVPRTGSDDGPAGSSRLGSLEAWSRVRVAPGVELHLHSERPKLRPGDLKQLLEQIEMVLRKHKS